MHDILTFQTVTRALYASSKGEFLGKEGGGARGTGACPKGWNPKQNQGTLRFLGPLPKKEKQTSMQGTTRRCGRRNRTHRAKGRRCTYRRRGPAPARRSGPQEPVVREDFSAPTQISFVRSFQGINGPHARSVAVESPVSTSCRYPRIAGQPRLPGRFIPTDEWVADIWILTSLGGCTRTL